MGASLPAVEPTVPAVCRNSYDGCFDLKSGFKPESLPWYSFNGKKRAEKQDLFW